MNVKASAEFKPGTVRPGPEFYCSECGTWFKKMLYWASKMFNPDQKYGIIFLCGPKCSLKHYNKWQKQDQQNTEEEERQERRKELKDGKEETKRDNGFQDPLAGDKAILLAISTLEKTKG